MELPIDQIKRGKNYSRVFGIGDIQELAASMQEHGQLQRILVTPDMELVAGYRRLAAATQLGWDTIKIEITNIDPGTANLIENLNREGLTLWEEIQGIRDVYGPDATVGGVARALSKSKTWVRPRIQVWTLPKEFQDEVRLGRRGIKDINGMLRERKDTSVQSKVKSYPKADEIKSAITELYNAGRVDEAKALSYAVGGIDRDRLLGNS